MRDKYIEIHVQGFVPPYDRIRVYKDSMSSCGTARMGMVWDVECPLGSDSWAGGVIDWKELKGLRDAIDEHLARIEALPEEAKMKYIKGGL